ncbi:MAG: aldehyde dehydrogenase family protein [Deinococcota bacterium]|nr:aldehyde dehydrogenase family protein [Deinococcota bacterium]
MTVKDIFETMDYGPAPESAGGAEAWLGRHKGKLDLFIGGRWLKPKTGEYFETVNPAKNRPLAKVAQAGEEDVDAAVKAAREAQPQWQALGGHGRARYLYALARQVQKHSRLFAVLESLDNGKTIRETRDLDIPLVARHFYHHAGWAQLMESEFAGFEPVGVAGQIIPWNFPLLMLAWKVAPALAMGNSVVLKPAEFTSLTALLFAEITQEVGLPPGVLNIVTGDGRTGELLVRHEGISKVAFTGSTEVGRLIREATAGSGKALTLELGGKSPFIVFDDADLDSTVEGVVDAIWFNQGQVCCAGSRLLLHEGIAARMIDKLRARMETLRVGDSLDKAVDIGAIVAPVQLARIQDLVRRGEEEGATLWQPSWACPTEGCFYPPTLFTEVSPASSIAQLEIFGPVLVSMTFRTPEEAVELANNTPYGLAASVWTENLNLALDVAPKLEAGTVWVNSSNLFDAAAGFGGYRESGYGREGGKEGLWGYLKPVWEEGLPPYQSPQPPLARGVGGGLPASQGGAGGGLPAIDRTPKMYIGGKQARPDSGYSLTVYGAGGRAIGEVGEGNRKDIRNAVEAAAKAGSWTKTTAHNRAQVLYYLAENLAVRAPELEARLAQLTGQRPKAAAAEVQAAIGRIFTYAAWADKFDGAVHHTPMRNVTLAMNEPIGLIGVACPDEAPLLAFVSLLMPAIATGNRVVVIPSPRYPLVATDFYQVLDTSDVPGGVVNIVTGERDLLAKTLAEHDAVGAMWYFGPAEGSEMVERASTGNLKRTWVNYGRARDWADPAQGQGQAFLRQATQVKNIWVPYGE